MTSVDDLTDTKAPTLAPRLTPLASALRLVSGTFGLAIVPGVQASMFVVNSLAEPGIGTPQDHCAPGNINTCTLRDAIALANSDSNTDADTVDLTSLTGTILLTQGQLTITSPSANGLIVQGPGASQLTISGNNASRIFYLNPPTRLSSAVTISGLTLSNGYTSSNGGAISSQNINLELQNSAIIASHADLRGGGVRALHDLNIISSTISGNTAVNGGGVYANGATANVISSTISDNSATSDGGGLYSGSDTTIVTDSTISGNTAGGNGGGIYANAFNVQLTNSTIIGNIAIGNGGGLYTRSSSDSSINSCTITGNQATNGGGIYLFQLATTPLLNTIVAGNFSTNATTPDIKGNFNGDFNLVGDLGSGATLTGGTHNQTGNSGNILDPLLSSLGDYGGPTLTQRPNSGSSVLGRGNCAALPQPPTDQRGESRPSGTCDIGAVEETIFIDSFETL